MAVSMAVVKAVAAVVVVAVAATTAMVVATVSSMAMAMMRKLVCSVSSGRGGARGGDTAWPACGGGAAA
jgi:hypothetical protein